MRHIRHLTFRPTLSDPILQTWVHSSPVLLSNLHFIPLKLKFCAFLNCISISNMLKQFVGKLHIFLDVSHGKICLAFWSICNAFWKMGVVLWKLCAAFLQTG